MTEPKEFFENLMADPETKHFMNGIKKKVESYGDDKDKFLNFMFGAMSSWYTSMENLIANVETIKVMLIFNSIGEGMTLMQDTIRKTDKPETAKAV